MGSGGVRVVGVLMMMVMVVVGDGSVGSKCSDDINKLTGCLNYATGKEKTPAAGCCSSVKDIKDSDPKCLCYLMQQASNGSDPSLKGLGIQPANLLQLPSACQLQNASVSDCPALLGLSPSSPAAAIFTNASTSTTAPATSSTGSSSPDKSDGNKHWPFLALPMAIMAIFIHSFTALLVLT